MCKQHKELVNQINQTRYLKGTRKIYSNKYMNIMKPYHNNIISSSYQDMKEIMQFFLVRCL